MNTADSTKKLQAAAAWVSVLAGMAQPLPADGSMAMRQGLPESGSWAAASTDAPAGYLVSESGILVPNDFSSGGASAASPHHRVTQPNITRRSIYKDALASSDQVSSVAARELRGISRYLVENEPTYRACMTNWVELGFSGEFRVSSSVTPDRLADVGVEASKKEIKAYRRSADRAFRAFCKSPTRSGEMTFSEMIPMAVAGEFVEGDIFFVATNRPAKKVRPKMKRGPLLRFCWQPVEGAQVADDMHAAEMPDGHTVSGGVERDEAGEPAALHVYRKHPGDSAAMMGGRFKMANDPFALYAAGGGSFGAGAFEVVRVPWRDEDGRLNVVRLMQTERPGQSRGLPRMRSAMGAALDAGEARDAGIELAKIATAFSIYVTEDRGSGAAAQRSGLAGVDPATGARAGADPADFEAIAPGMVRYMRPGQKVNSAQPPVFTPMVKDLNDSLTVLMASSIGFSYELVTGDFRETTYSSARAAIETAWPSIKRFQRTVIDTIIKESYCRVIEEAVVRGIVKIPGADAAILADRDPFGDAWDEWCEITVIAPAPPRIDIAKEIKGYVEAIRSKLTTRSHAASQFFGSDFDSTAKTLKAEDDMLGELGFDTLEDDYGAFDGERPGNQPTRDHRDEDDNEEDDNDKNDKRERDELDAVRFAGAV